MAITTFDSIFEHIGGFGRYQMFLFAINCFMNILLVFVYFGQIFMTLTPPHWCRAPPDLAALDLTPEQLKDLTIPRDAATGEYAKCSRYDLDSFSSEVVLGNNITIWPNSSWPTTTCTYGWSYNFTQYYPTITSELNWVCEEDFRPALAQSLFFAGSLIASPLFGWAADRFGRIPIIIFTNVLGGVMGIGSAFATSFTSFAFCRMLVGVTSDSHFMLVYILLLEYVSSEYRTFMANVPIMVFLTAGLCVVPWLALGVANWSNLAIILHAPQFLTVFFIWLVPESARWLLSQGKISKTLSIIRRAATVNRRPLTQQVVDEFKEFGAKEAEERKANITIVDLFKTPILRMRFIVLCIMWMVTVLAYDGHIRNTENIGYDFFVTFTIVGVVEFPADLLTMLSIEKLGRRLTTVLSLVTSGVVCLVIATVPQAFARTILGLEVLGRFLITMSMNVATQYPIEVLPTVARGLGSGVIHTLGSSVVFLSPYIAYLSKVGFYVPFVILGVVSISGGLVSSLLPETLNEDLPDTLHDGETFFANQSFCYNPCVRASKGSYIQADVTEAPDEGSVEKKEPEKRELDSMSR